MAAVIEGTQPGFLKTKALVPFQAEGVATTYLRGSHFFLWDCGMGKSVGAVALAVLCHEDSLIDQVVLVCERNKVREWVEDFEIDTDFSVGRHHGPGREKRLERLGMPQVLVTTYETLKRDSVVKAGPRKLVPGPLLDRLKGKRTLVVLDESAKLRNRSSDNYRAMEYVLKTLRKTAGARVLALSATPLEKSWEDVFNQFRLLVPEHVPGVVEWEKACIRYRDPYGRPTYDHAQIQLFADSIRPHINRKRKTDPDVIAQFPPLVEDYRFVEMGPAQKDLYRTIEQFAIERSEDETSTAAWNVLRQIAGHPASIIHSAARPDGSKLSKEIVSVLDEQHLRSVPSAKTEELKAYLKLILDQDAKALVFTFFGRSVLPMLDGALQHEGIRVFTYHGGKTGAENEAAKDAFKNHQGGAVLLSSDGGSRGINVPEATYVIEYESALTHAGRIQRRERAHRINSASGPVTAMTFIAEGTLEEQIFAGVLKRNAQTDIFTGDDGVVEEEFVSSFDRRAILAAARQRHQAGKR